MLQKIQQKIFTRDRLSNCKKMGLSNFLKYLPLEATDFRSLMRFNFLFNRIYGLSPYKMAEPFLDPSPLQQTYSLFFTIFAICGSFYFLYQIDLGYIEYNSTPGLIHGNCYLMFITFVAVASFIFNEPRRRVLKNLNRASLFLCKEKFKHLSKIIFPKDITIFTFMFVHAFNLKRDNILNTFLNVTTFNLSVSLFLIDALYMNCVLVLKACFEGLNEEIEAIKNTVITSESHLLRRVYHEQYNHCLVKRLYEVKKHFEDLGRFVYKFNSTFSVHLVASISISFLDITFNLYFYILTVKGQKGINPEYQIWYVVFFTPAIFHLVKISLTLWLCQKVKDEAQKVGSFVHDLIIHTVDKEFKEELHLFSLQILHQDNGLSMKTLPVDATLLTEIIGGVTTYLFILIQFLMSAHPNTSNP